MDVEHGRVGRGELLLAGVGLLAALLVSCTRVPTIEVSAGAPPALAGPVPTEPESTFQGSVASLDPAAAELVVDVRIVWTPVLTAERSERRVSVSPATRWEPAGTGLPGLRRGDEVQVKADSGPDGTWRARSIQLFDIE